MIPLHAHARTKYIYFMTIKYRFQILDLLRQQLDIICSCAHDRNGGQGLSRESGGNALRSLIA